MPYPKFEEMYDYTAEILADTNLGGHSRLATSLAAILCVLTEVHAKVHQHGKKNPEADLDTFYLATLEDMDVTPETVMLTIGKSVAESGPEELTRVLEVLLPR